MRASVKAALGIRDRRPYKEKVEVEPGLVRSYLKAKKEKVCPLVEFV